MLLLRHIWLFLTKQLFVTLSACRFRAFCGECTAGPCILYYSNACFYYSSLGVVESEKLWWIMKISNIRFEILIFDWNTDIWLKQWYLKYWYLIAVVMFIRKNNIWHTDIWFKYWYLIEILVFKWNTDIC